MPSIIMTYYTWKNFVNLNGCSTIRFCLEYLAVIFSNVKHRSPEYSVQVYGDTTH